MKTNYHPLKYFSNESARERVIFDYFAVKTLGKPRKLRIFSVKKLQLY